MPVWENYRRHVPIQSGKENLSCVFLVPHKLTPMVADTVILAGSVTDVAGVVPAEKTLYVVGNRKVIPNKALTIRGELELHGLTTELHAGNITASGRLVMDGGTLTSESTGTLYLPVYVDGPVPAYATYQSAAAYPSKGVDSLIQAGNPTAFIQTNVAHVVAAFNAPGGPNELTVENLTNIVRTTIPQGKTLYLKGTGNTIDVSSYSFDPFGRLEILEGRVNTNTTDTAKLASVLGHVYGTREVWATGAITTLTDPGEKGFVIPSGINLTLTNAATTFVNGEFDIVVDGKLTLAEAVIDFKPAGNVKAEMTGSIVLQEHSVFTVATLKALTLEGNGSVSGLGTIKAEGDGSSGSIILSTIEYTTEGGQPVVANNLLPAKNAIVAATNVLKDKDSLTLDNDLFKADDTLGIGSITLTTTSATAIKAGTDAEHGDPIVLVNVALTGTLDGTAYIGPDSLTESDFTLSLVAGQVNIEDSSNNGNAADKFGAIEFDAVQLTYNDLIGPVLDAFHVGVVTSR
jgi:hypothetical protein